MGVELQPDRADGVVFAPDAPVSSAEAIERAYIAHYASVFRYAVALTRSVADAEDVTAETFARAVRSWSTVPPRPLPWLLLVARRISTDRARRARRSLIALAHARPAATPNAGETRTEFWAWFDAVGAVLTDRQREALVLRYERDLADTDIGDVLGLSESGVRTLISRALAILRAHRELL